MIIAHHRFDFLDRLLGAIEWPHSERYIHVDAKVASLPSLQHRAVFASERIDVKWGGFSQVQATLSLMRTAVANPDHDYFLLLSGVDYPVRPVSELIEFLSGHREDCINMTEFGRLGKSIDRLLVPFDERGSERCTGFHASLLRYKNRLFELLYRVTKLRRRLPEGTALTDFRAGSQWFALTRKTVESILCYVDEHPEYVEFCKRAKIPDEFFFQSVIHFCGLSASCRPNLHYADWQKGPPPYPSEISDIHLEDLKEACVLEDGYGAMRPVFFARKFGEASANVLAELDMKNLSLSNICQ